MDYPMPAFSSFPLRLLPLFVFTLLLGCDTAPASAPENDALEELGPNASLIRSPVDAGDGSVDTSAVARMNFAEPTFEFGSVSQGEVVKHEFVFTNTGALPLLITDARSTCGCTVPSYPQQPVAPGEEAVINVAFDTKNKSGRQSKPVTITANTYPATTTIYVVGTVNTK